jgi:hypothetical protein
MSSIYRKFKQDKAIERDGIELEYGDGAVFKIARAGGANKAFKTRMEQLQRKYKRQLHHGLLTEEQGRAILIAVYADTVILGWDGVTDEDDNPLDFTRENVVRVLSDLPDLFDDIRSQAEDAGLFRETLQELDAKN